MTDLPQLRMRREMSLELPELVIPDGYNVARAQLEDADGLAEVLTASFGDLWTRERVCEVLLQHPEVPETCLVRHGARIVATASYQVMPVAFPGDGWVHYVGVEPGHAGKGLGKGITLVILHEIARNKHPMAWLTTDDHRLPAIVSYLRLGFEPDRWHESHEGRWNAVFQQIGIQT